MFRQRMLIGLTIVHVAAALAWAQAGTVKITPLGSRTGNFCAQDRALLFEDPTGVRILYDPGNTVRGGDDSRLGAVDAILISHAHADHIGAHSVIRLSVRAETVTLELAEEIYRHLAEATSSGGPYAAIYDLSATKHTTMPTELVRSFARRPPSIPPGREHVIVGTEPHIYGLARVFQMCSEARGKEFQVVDSLDEAYGIVGVHPEDFTAHSSPQEALLRAA